MHRWVIGFFPYTSLRSTPDTFVQDFGFLQVDCLAGSKCGFACGIVKIDLVDLEVYWEDEIMRSSYEKSSC
jgi:hypothetical protein